ncbi:MAG: pseudouridine synthase [Ignavibacteria bacterium]|nr:pseudouridine synthase [Ignavibacteria bacterium]
MIIVLNKPYGVLSQFTAEPGSSWKTLGDFNLPKDVYPIGRLDADSEGMLLLSDEKSLVSRILDPANAHTRTYWAQVEHIVHQHGVNALEQGVVVQGRRTRPCKARILHPSPIIAQREPPIRHRAAIPTSWIEVTLTEGRNRQVRRMTAAAGHPTLRLIRVGIGNLYLETLRLDVGHWCQLSATNRSLLLEHA